MVLLLPIAKATNDTENYNLHSNMVLLLLSITEGYDASTPSFTFQYGATSTENFENCKLCKNTFTFQYGATSTNIDSNADIVLFNLHSNMVLLLQLKLN